MSHMMALASLSLATLLSTKFIAILLITAESAELITEY